ncbi:MAG: pyridoxamine 5'-phosphate oxidase family protein [Alphaproteobacteria bacterium]
MLTDDMKRVIREQKLGFLASVNADGTPNLSPKATYIVLDDTTIAFVELRSPNTMRNLARNPSVALNFVDPFVRKGYRFQGRATAVMRGADGFDALFARFGDLGGLAEAVRAVVRIDLEEADALISPAYDRGATEHSLRQDWTRKFRDMQPGGIFDTGV